MGRLNIVSAKAPDKMLKPQPICNTKNRNPNRPTTMEGNDESASMAVFTKCVKRFFGAYSVR